MRKRFPLALGCVISLLTVTSNTNAQTCTLPLNGGTVNPTSTIVCPDVHYGLYVNGSTSGSGLTFQWQSSPDNITWSDLEGFTESGMSTTQRTDTWYRRKMKCGAADSAYSTSVLIQTKPFSTCYCNPNLTSCNATYSILNVSFASINNTTTCGTNGYSDYTTAVSAAGIRRGGYQPITVTTTSSTQRDVFCIIDFNQNGLFEPKEFTTLTPQPNGVYNGFIKVPYRAHLGSTRMRIFYKTGNASPCFPSLYSETEDYTVTILPATTAATGYTIHVKPSAPGSNGTGSGWDNAMTSLRAAIYRAFPGDTIKVAQGTYYSGTTATDGIVLMDSIIILGGYPDTGNPSNADRNPGLHPTILSGFQSATYAASDFHVLYATGTMNDCTVDGFILQNGGTSYGVGKNYRGGGISVENNANITVRSCVFRNNYQHIEGSAIAVNNAKPAFVNCIITDNTSDESSILIQNKASVTFTNLLAARNTGKMLMLVDSARVTIKNGTIAENSTAQSLIETKRRATVNVVNTISYHNALHNSSWQSIGFDFPDVSLNASTFTAHNSILQMKAEGTNLILGIAPRFRDASSVAGADGFFFTADDGFALQNPCSPALNAGSNSEAAGIETDITGNNRRYGAAVDLGAYESQQPVTASPKVIYVNAAATGKNNGTTWTDAYTDLQQALQACSDTVKVAAGTYYPWKGAAPGPYWIENKRVIWGAYPATGNPDNKARDYNRFPTIINGQTATGGKEKILVRGQSLDSTSVLDGLTFSGTDLQRETYEWGAMIYAACNNPVISNCRFTGNGQRVFLGRNNTNPLFLRCSFDRNSVGFTRLLDLVNCTGSVATTFQNCSFQNNVLLTTSSYDQDFGSVVLLNNTAAILDSCLFMYNLATALASYNSNPLVSHTQFRYNYAHEHTADVYNKQSAPVFRQCEFRDSALSVSHPVQGGIATNIFSTPTFIDCQFYNGDGKGGAAYNETSNTVFNNCVFSNCRNALYNTWGSHIRLNNCIATGSIGTEYVPAFMQNSKSSPILNNCVVVNSAAYLTGLIKNDDESAPEINNSVFWRNIPPRSFSPSYLNARSEIINTGAARPSIHNSMFEFYKAEDSGNTVGKDPRFKNYANPVGDDGRWFTADDGLQLCDCSPAINSGSNTYATTATDIKGQPRIVNTTIDRGAYELQTTPPAVVPTVAYVQASATGTGDGTSWSTAYNNLNQALAGICFDTIKIAGGTYKPAITGRDSVFTLDRNLVILGSYQPASGLRDVDATPTILSGDIGIPGDSADNSFGIVNAINLDSLMLDGLVFKDANRNTTAPVKNQFALNATRVGKLRITNCRFTGNTGNGSGSAVYTSFVNTLEIRNTVFSRNRAVSGAGLYTSGGGSQRWLTNCVFEKNLASQSGGGIWWGGSGGLLTNCVFTQNEALQGAGMYLDNSPDITVTNCTFAANKIRLPETVGGGIYSSGYAWQGGGAGPLVGNCLFTGNSINPPFGQTNYGDLYYPKNGYEPGYGRVDWRIHHSAVSTLPLYYHGVGLVSPGAVTYRNPANPIGPDGKWFTADDGLQLVPCSEGIDNGDNTILTVPADLVGNNRIIGPVVDMGAYEFKNGPFWLQLFEKASDSITANKERTDSVGWTHYYRDCTYLLSIKKNGKNIGTIGDGTFEVKIATTANYGSGFGMNLTAAAYNTAGLPWYVMNRYWNVKSAANINDSILVRFPYNNTDFADVRGSNPQVTQHTDLEFFKVRGTANPFDLTVPAASFTRYTQAPAPSLKTWTYTKLDSIHLCEYYVSSFSGGGGGAHLNAGFPDLEITSPSVTADSVSAGDSLTLRFTEQNLQPAVPVGAHKTQVFLSPDSVLTPGANGDILLNEQFMAQTPGTGRETISKRLLLPCATSAGAYTLFLVADATNAVAEINEKNNTASLPLKIGLHIPPPAIPVITASPAAAVCSGTTITLTATSSACTNCTYTWSNGTPGPTLRVTTGGSYAVKAANNCGNASGGITIAITPTPVVTITATDTAVCLGGQLTLTAAGASAYTWTGSGLNTTAGSQVVAAPPSAGRIVYTATGTKSGCTDTATISINVKQPPQVTITPADTSICPGATVSLAAAGATSYSWSPASGLSTATGPTVAAAPAATTTYTVTGTLDGCSNTATTTVSVTAAVTPSVTITYTGCPGNTISFTATPVNGGSNPRFQWYVNNVLQTATGAGLILNNATNNTVVYAKLLSAHPCASPQTVVSDPLTVTCITTATPEIDGLESFSVSPNPGNGLWTVKLKLTQRRKITFSVLDATGKNSYAGTPLQAVGTVIRTIDLRDKPAGIYYLKTTVGRDTRVDKLVILR